MDPQEPRPPSQPGPYSQPGQYPPPPPHPQGPPPGSYPPPAAYPPPGPHPQQWGAPPPYPQQWGAPQYPAQFAPREPRTIPAPAGTPYHRLARTAKHAWWRPIVGTLFLGAGILFITAGVAVAWEIVHGLITGEISQPQGNDIFPSATENLALTLVMLGALTPFVAFTAWLVQRRPFWSVASVLNRIRWRWLLMCCLPGLGYLALSLGLGVLVDAIFPNQDAGPTDDGGSWVGFGAFVVPALVIILLVPFQSAAEEFLFRGWLIQAVSAYGPDQKDGPRQWIRTLFRSPWPGIVIASAAFVSAHGYTGWAMADIFLFAVMLGWLTVRTGGLEAGIALHAMNNLFAFLLPAATGRLDGWDDQGGAPWTLLVSDIPCLVFYAAAVVWLARRQPIARVS
ncbi:type II CAAX endopeptidase family protein [Kribbella sp. NPDC026596]|uniref:CPBP family intramembrane glutamic endopeptidase n=1 Tax=Kribbella sp. NPDC026596 TaxID=3155122 RepID=UPI0033DDF996